MTFRRLFLMTFFGAILGGCQASPWASSKNEDVSATKAVVEKTENAENSPATSDIAKTTSTTDAASVSSEKTATVAAGKSPTDATAANAQALQEVMAEVRDLGVLDPQEQANLLENLRQTDPALWPLMVKQVRAAIAYRRQLMERSQIAASAPIRTSTPKTERSNAPAMLPETEGTTPLIMPLGESAHPLAKDESDVYRYEDSSVAQSALRFAPLAATKLDPSFKAAQDRWPADRMEQTRSYPSSRQKTVDEAKQVVQASYETREARNITPPPEAIENSAEPSAVETAKTPPANADWRELMAQTIKAMEADVPEQPKTAEDIAKQAQLRMLYALAGRREDAAKPIPTAPPAMQDFWTKELYGLSILLDTERTPDAMTRAAEAKQHLSDGFTRLGEMAPLQVRNLSFCTEVSSFGCYTLFKKYEFLPGQEVLLYAEVENFGIDSTKKGYHTSLRSSYQILDSAGQRIADHAISTTEEYCRNPRRDFFIGSLLRMPSRINPGKYTLQLTIEDLKSQKVGQASVELTIKGGEKEKIDK
jgi:hypothetical protein